MTYDLTITDNALSEFKDALAARFEEVREPVQRAMASMFYAIVQSNFGDFGMDRPITWAPLSAAYSKKMGRANATLFVTGALQSAIKLESSQECGKVSVSDEDVPYALIHQFGSAPGVIGNVKSGGHTMPARPYFPMDESGEITQFTRDRVDEAARDELQRLIGGTTL